MTEVLSQDEIDQLLSAISAPAQPKFKDIGEFESYLLKRADRNEERYGRFTDNPTVCKFFEDKNNESILSDIMQRNDREGMGNTQIPNTKIKLINYSYCPNCKKVYSFGDLRNYFRRPKKDANFSDIDDQYRHDTRVYCFDCNIFFLPTLIISDGTPKSMCQFLCQIQAVNSIEAFYLQTRRLNVLTRERKNLLSKNNRHAVKNDVLLKDLEPRPALISNLVQYTPADLIMNLIDGTNVERGDILYGQWSSEKRS